ncbi:MAG: hypothetical protein KDD02_04280 [Phaeodactylibacter sp.]|nr:hypothetical protein [Phaeodactylibacter sp.]
MKKLIVILAALSIFVLLNSCQKDQLQSPAPQEELALNFQDLAQSLDLDVYGIAKELVATAEWPVEVEMAAGEVETRGIGVHNYYRQVIADDIAHYWFTVRIGSGPYSRIAIHRVVKEWAPNRPINTSKALFFQHGDAKDFVGMTLPGLNSPSTPRDFGMAAYLAKNDVDVWGIDQAWNLVPDNVTDYSFMADWGLDKQQKDLRRAMGIARLARYLTGSPNARMILAGYSSGVATGFAALNAETQIGQGQRNIKGFIPIDLAIKTDDQKMLNTFLAEYYRTRELLDNETYEDFIVFRMLGQLGKEDPDGESPIFPGFTNMQAAMFLGAGLIYGEPHSHFLAGMRENDFPVGFQFLTVDQWLDFMQAAPLYEPAQFVNDYSVMMTGIEDSPFDDHFAEITVPILNLAAYGGLGYPSEYAFSFIGSTDVTHHIIQLLPDDQGMLDFGHIDIFLANNAEELAWQPLLEWIEEH